MKFTDLNFQPHPNYTESGIQARHFFPNGYGVSVVSFPGSYGFREGLYEVAVIKGKEDDWQICYDTHITDDVIGHNDEKDVETIINNVQSL
jgi:hypothetical protein